jgi:hypothetical protein
VYYPAVHAYERFPWQHGGVETFHVDHAWMMILGRIFPDDNCGDVRAHGAARIT